MLKNLLHIPFTKSYIDTKSLLYKKTPRIDDHFGVYAITGFQGTGKTYNAVDFASKIDLNNVEIITNIHSLQLPHRNFNTISEITSNFEQHKLFIIDEIYILVTTRRIVKQNTKVHNKGGGIRDITQSKRVKKREKP